jgi:endonuclease YncB( thermonuclease family)
MVRADDMHMTLRRRRRLPVVSLALLLWLLPAAHAQARSGPCFPGARGAPCHFQTATVTSVNDGDTIDVDLDGDRSRRIYPIRFRAVQAMELRRYSLRPSRRRGECHAVAAANRVEDLVRGAGKRVRLSSQAPSADHLGRLVRWVAVRRHGRWQDLGEILMRQGHTLWMDSTADTAWNRRYDLLGQRAAQAHRNLWDTATCGAGPQQNVPIRVWAMSDPPGIDTADGEWVKVQNRSTTETLQLGGWWLRDAMLRRFTFPAGSAVAPGATVTVHVASGTSSGSELYWGLRTTVFENAGDGRDLGDGAYLFDPQGDLRAWMLYPCLAACSDPYQGALDVIAQPRRPEHVTIRNRADFPVDLYGYALAIRGATFPFDQGSILQPGETLTVFMQGSSEQDSRDERHLGIDGYALPDSGGWVRVSAFNGVALACDAWGDGAC